MVYGTNQLLGWEASNYDACVAKNDHHDLFREINRRPGASATLARPQRDGYGNLAGTATVFSPHAAPAIVATGLRSGPATSASIIYTNLPRDSYTSTFAALPARGYHVGGLPRALGPGLALVGAPTRSTTIPWPYTARFTKTLR